MQYSASDSAFKISWFMLSAHKKLRDSAIPHNHEQFNRKLAAMQIISEHCIGMLKGRFPWLCSISLIVDTTAKSLRIIFNLIEYSIVLHNMLTDLGDQIDNKWIDMEAPYQSIEIYLDAHHP